MKGTGTRIILHVLRQHITENFLILLQLGCTPAEQRKMVLVLEETPKLADHGHEVDAGDEAQDVAHGAESFAESRMADVDVAVCGQGHRQPH